MERHHTGGSSGSSRTKVLNLGSKIWVGFLVCFGLVFLVCSENYFYIGGFHCHPMHFILCIEKHYSEECLGVTRQHTKPCSGSRLEVDELAACKPGSPISREETTTLLAPWPASLPPAKVLSNLCNFKKSPKFT